MPAEQDGRCQNHAHAVGGGEDGGRDEVERGIGEEKGVVALERADDRTEHRQRSDAIEQDGGGQSVGQRASSPVDLPVAMLFVGSPVDLFSVAGIAWLAVSCPLLAVDEPVEAAVDVEARADDSAHGQGDDEEHGILALGEVGDGGVQADGQRGQSQLTMVPIIISDLIRAKLIFFR